MGSGSTLYKIDPSDLSAPLVTVDISAHDLALPPYVQEIFYSSGYLFISATVGYSTPMVYVVSTTTNTLVGRIVPNPAITVPKPILSTNNKIWIPSASGVCSYALSNTLSSFPSSPTVEANIALPGGSAVYISPDSTGYIWAGNDIYLSRVALVGYSVTSYTNPDSLTFPFQVLETTDSIWTVTALSTGTYLARFLKSSGPTSPTLIEITSVGVSYPR
jgi:hypothetical protein